MTSVPDATPLGEHRHAFDVPDDVAYFNTANLAPYLHTVHAAGEAALQRRSRPWLIGSDDWSDDVERARALLGDLIGADAEGVAMVPATSYGFAVAARALRILRGQRILVLAEEYPSGIYTWRAAAAASGAEVLTVARDPEQSWTEAILGALDERVAIVSVPNVHWTNGALVDLPLVAARTRDLGARLVVDASQSLGAMPFDVHELQPDFVIAVGYKWLLGPFSVGYMYVADEHRDAEPLEQNWISRAGSEDFSRLVEYRDEYQPGARRFDGGQRTKFELMPMAVAALSQLVEWQVPRIAASLARVTGRIAEGAARYALLAPPADQRAPHLLGLRIPAVLRESIEPALSRANCFAAVRGDSLRIAPHLHVTDRDITRLLDALASAVEARARD